MGKRSFRKRFEFWLDLWNDTEAELADLIAELKENRLFVATIRDGLRLITDLRKGSVTVLLELFPWLIEAIEGAQKPSGGGSGDNVLLAEIQALRKEVKESQQPDALYQRHALPLPQNDDLSNLLEERELTEEERAERGRQATQNFLTSLATMAAPSRVERGPKKMDVPATLPPPVDVDDDLLALVQ